MASYYQLVLLTEKKFNFSGQFKLELTRTYNLKICFKNTAEML